MQKIKSKDFDLGTSRKQLLVRNTVQWEATQGMSCTASNNVQLDKAKGYVPIVGFRARPIICSCSTWGRSTECENTVYLVSLQQIRIRRSSL
jgi:hypothetical protein